MTCSQCRDICSSNCIQFKSTFTLFLKSAEEEEKNYLQNFVTDYFNLSEITLEKIFNVQKPNESKEKIKTFVDVKIYHKSEKNRSQVVMKTLENCNKIQNYTKRSKHYYYKKN